MRVEGGSDSEISQALTPQSGGLSRDEACVGAEAALPGTDAYCCG